MGTQLPSPKVDRAPQFSAHVYCGQTAGWIKMPLGRQVGLSKRHCGSWGPSSPSPKWEQSPFANFRPCLLWPDCWMDHDVTWRGGRSRPRPYCARWGPSCPSPKVHSPQFLAYICCGQMAGWIKMPLGREIGLSPSDIVLDGDPAPPRPKVAEPQFSSHVYCGQTVDGFKMALGTEVGLSSVQRRCVGWGTSSPL